MAPIASMTPFDAKAATDAYLAVLPPAAHLKAIHYTQGGHWLLLWGWAVTVAACWLIAKSRVLTRTQAAIFVGFSPCQHEGAAVHGAGWRMAGGLRV